MFFLVIFSLFFCNNACNVGFFQRQKLSMEDMATTVFDALADYFRDEPMVDEALMLSNWQKVRLKVLTFSLFKFFCGSFYSPIAARKSLDCANSCRCFLA